VLGQEKKKGNKTCNDSGIGEKKYVKDTTE
jgi:hypothetical protein